MADAASRRRLREVEGGPRLRTNAAIVLSASGGILLIVGSFMPWVVSPGLPTGPHGPVGPLRTSGITADWGILTLVLGLLALAVAILMATARLGGDGSSKPLSGIAALILGLASVGLARVGFHTRFDAAASAAMVNPDWEPISGGPASNLSAEMFREVAAFVGVEISAGTGLYVCALGGLLVAAGGVVWLARIPMRQGSSPRRSGLRDDAVGEF